jgi:hypothetical protein
MVVFLDPSAPTHTVAAMDFGILALVAYGQETTTDACLSGSRVATNVFGQTGVFSVVGRDTIGGRKIRMLCTGLAVAATTSQHRQRQCPNWQQM